MAVEQQDLIPKQQLSRSEVIQVFTVAIVWSVILTNPSKFFIGLGIAPGLTIAGLLGSLAIPLIPSYLIAKVVAKRKSYSLYRTWLCLTIVILTIQSIGTVRGAI